MSEITKASSERKYEASPEQLNLCLSIAIKAHEGRLDLRGKPSVLHSIAVAKACETVAEQCVGLLHDVVEDTEWTLYDLLKAGVDEPIVAAVDCITKRKGESLKKYDARVESNPISDKVKEHDRENNSSHERTDRTYAEAKKKTSKKYATMLTFKIQLETQKKYRRQIRNQIERRRQRELMTPPPPDETLRT